MIKPKKSVEHMDGYFVPMYDNDWDYKLDSNENNYGPSNKVINALRNFDSKRINYYPFYGELSKKIADYYGFCTENIKVTNGADEAIQGIIQTYLEKNESILTVDVSFEMPVIYTKIQAGNIIRVSYDKKWEFPVEKFLRELNDDNIKIVYIASPNNPTGSIINEEDFVKILEKAKSKVVILDETYANYSSRTYKKYVKEYENLFLVRSFSKDFALAGLRLGCVISNEENIRNLRKVISPFSVNSFAMIAGMTALEDEEYFLSIKDEINKSKTDLKLFFESLGAVVYESYANFLLVDFKEKANFVYNKLKKANISVKLFKKGSLLENHLRITIPAVNGVKKIKEILKIKPALVFDMDGVLIDARNSYRLAVEKTYEKFSNQKISHEEIQTAKNGGGLNNDWTLTQYLLTKAGYSIDYEKIVETFNNFYWNDEKGFINNETPLFNREVFEKLSQNYNLSIFTGRLRHEADFAIKKFKMEDLFYPVITTDDIPVGMEKPNPFGLNLMKEKTIGSEYYYFGDTPDDILAAKQAGYIEVGVLPPQDKSENLVNIMKEKGAKFVVNSVNEIEKILEYTDERSIKK